MCLDQRLIKASCGGAADKKAGRLASALTSWVSYAGKRSGFCRTKGDTSGHCSQENKTEEKKSNVCAVVHGICYSLNTREER